VSDQDRGGGYLQGLIMGALIGAGLYYVLTSTKEGKKVKKILKEEGEGVLGDLAKLTTDLEKKGEVFRTEVNRLQAELEERVEDGSEEEVVEAKNKLNHIDYLRDRGRRATKKFFVRNGKTLSS